MCYGTPDRIKDNEFTDVVWGSLGALDPEIRHDDMAISPKSTCDMGPSDMRTNINDLTMSNGVSKSTCDVGPFLNRHEHCKK